MRRLIVVAGILILVGAIGAAYYESTHRFGGSVRGTTTEFVPTLTVAPPQPSKSSIVSPMFAGVPQHLHVGVGKVRPPFRLDWVSGGTSLIEFPPAIGFHYLYYASLNGNLIAVSARNGRRLWTDPVGRCEAAGPALNRLGRGSVYETFLNREPCGRGTAKGEGELLVVAAGPGHALRWRRSMGVTETSPLIVGSRVYVGDYGGRVYCLNSGNGKTLWTYQAGGAVKGAITYDRGRVFFGAYDGRLYALRASDGKLIWRAQSERDWLGAHGQFYSTPSVAYSRVYLGSTDGHVYSFGEQERKAALVVRHRRLRVRLAGDLAPPRLRRLVRPHVLRLQRGDGSAPLEVPGERPDLRLRDRRRRHRLLRHPQAAHVRPRRAHGEAGVDVPRRRVHARGDRRAEALRRRLGQGLRLQPAGEVAEMIEIDLDGKVVAVPRDVVTAIATAAAAHAGVSERHRDLSLHLDRALESGQVHLGRGEVRALVAVLEEAHPDGFGPAAADLRRAVA